MMERTEDVYAMQSDQQQNTSTTQYDQGRVGRGGFRGRGRGEGIGRGQGPITCYRHGQQGHYARDYNKPTTICQYCKSHEHTVEDCPILQNKWQEKRPQLGNQNVQLIGVDNHNPYQNLNIITQSRLMIDGAQEESAKQPTVEWVRKMTMRLPTFDLQKEKEMFLHA